MNIDKVYQGVIEAILKTNYNDQEEYLENIYDINMVSNELKNAIYSDINKIYTDNKFLLEYIYFNIDNSHNFGINLYLTQNKHGCGFFDSKEYGNIGLFLTDYIDKNLKEYSVFIDDYGLICKDL